MLRLTYSRTVTTPDGGIAKGSAERHRPPSSVPISWPHARGARAPRRRVPRSQGRRRRLPIARGIRCPFGRPKKSLPLRRATSTPRRQSPRGPARLRCRRRTGRTRSPRSPKADSPSAARHARPFQAIRKRRSESPPRAGLSNHLGDGPNRFEIHRRSPIGHGASLVA